MTQIEVKENSLSSTLSYVAGSTIKVLDLRNIKKDPKVHVSFYSVNFGPLTIYIDDIDVADFKANMIRVLNDMESEVK